MRPVPFPEQNVVFAENQPEYQQLPAYVDGDGQAVSCWKLTFFERLCVCFTGKVWLRILTFNKPLQPVTLETESPFEVVH